MSGWSLFSLIEGGLIFGLVTVWGLFELRGLKREAQRREAREAQARREAADAAGSPPERD